LNLKTVPRPHRRDWLITTAYTTAGLGAALALWPFITAMQTPDDVSARRTVFDTAALTGIAPALVNVGQTPVMIFRRTAQELIGLRTPDPKLRDPNSAQSRQPEWATNWHRSLRSDIMVCVATCSRGDAIVRRQSAESQELLCPNCGTHYDLAGRVFQGPGPTNLRVPPHRFISTTEIEFAEATIKAARVNAPWRAGPA
jgi:ubiquinol-cytochrome c reductase iron-sulfur subunit